VFLALILAAFLPFEIFAQRHPQIENLPKFDRRMYHFGFILGVNQMNFAVKPVPDLHQFDSLIGVTTKPDFGFDIGIVSSLRIANHFNIRFIPTLSFGDRSLEYSVKLKDSIVTTQVKRVESTFMEFPLLLKYKSRRLTNFQVYVVGGAKYVIDMASQADKKNKNLNEAPVKLRKSDFLGEIGTGCDFYLTYFKFGIELKMSYGLRDLLKREDSIYTNSVKRLNSKIFQLSFTFEG
jgi:hypothetical protein